jgi:hypothetical protein
MNVMVPFLWTAGAVQLAIAISNLWVPDLLHYRENIARLSPMVRQVFVVHSIYIVLVLLGFGTVCLLYAPQLAGSPLGRFLCAFLAFFWLLRVGFQFGYYDRQLRAKYRAGDVAYTFAVSCLGIVFALAALGVGR